jgi:RNA polymerase sigma-70 factor (sigma-E family)
MRAEETAEFTAFVRARSGALFRTAILLTGERAQAEDLLQSTLERVCKHWRRVSRADSPEAYARRILVNLVHDRGRRRRRGVEVPWDGHDVAAGPDPHDPRDPYHRLAVRDELLRVLRSLPVNMRTVLVLRYFDDLPDPDIAAALGIAESTVRSQAARGLAKMRVAAGGRTIESPHGGGQ